MVMTKKYICIPVLLLLSGCVDHQCNRTTVLRAKAFIECEASEKCRLTAEDYYVIAYGKDTYPHCFAQEVEK